MSWLNGCKVPFKAVLTIYDPLNLIEMRKNYDIISLVDWLIIVNDVSEEQYQWNNRHSAEKIWNHKMVKLLNNEGFHNVQRLIDSTSEIRELPFMRSKMSSYGLNYWIIT